MYDSLFQDIADYNDPNVDVFDPPVANTVTILAAINPQFQIGTQDVIISLDIDGDAKPIVMPFQDQEIIITAQIISCIGGFISPGWYLLNPDLNGVQIPDYCSIKPVQAALDYTNNFSTTWSWEVMEVTSTNNNPDGLTDIVKIKGTNLTGNPNTPLNISPFHAWFEIVPKEGYGVTRMQMRNYFGAEFSDLGFQIPLGENDSSTTWAELTGISGVDQVSNLYIGGGVGLWDQAGQQLPVVVPGYPAKRVVNPTLYVNGYGNTLYDFAITLSNLCGITDSLGGSDLSSCYDCCTDQNFGTNSMTDPPTGDVSVCANMYYIDTNPQTPQASYPLYACSDQWWPYNYQNGELSQEYVDELAANTVLVAWGENIGDLTPNPNMDEIRIKINVGMIVPSCLEVPPQTQAMPYNINISVPD